MLESLPTNPLVTGVITSGAVVLALVAIWTKGIKPFGKWVGEAVRNLRRIADYMEQMVDFLTRERLTFRADIEEVKRQNAEGIDLHDDHDRRLRAVEQAVKVVPTEGP